MKKINLILILTLILVLCTLTLASCSDQLKTPNGLYLDSDTLTLRWNKVDGARFYTVEITGMDKPITTKDTKVSLENLDPGNYEVKIRANGDGETVEDSDFAVYNFTREHETGLRYQLVNNETEYQLIGGGTASGDVVMESTYRGKPVTSIADKALYNNPKITSFTVGSNVKTIGAKAFARCGKLTSVTVPNSVVSLGEYTFQHCQAMTTITLPDSITVIPPQAFASCELLTNVTIGQYVTTISERAFSQCKALTSISYNGCVKGEYNVCLPSTVKNIGTYAFVGCLSLPDVNLGNNVEIIESYAFSRCEKITKVNLGEKLGAIGDYAFVACSSLTSVKIPDSTKVLGNGVFEKCQALADVTLGSGLVRVGANLLAETAYKNNVIEQKAPMMIVNGWLLQVLDTAAEKISVTAKHEVYAVADFAFQGCNTMHTAEFVGVKYVGYAAFAYCELLNYALFDNSLLEIGGAAFYECKQLTKVTVGTAITSIGNYAFYNCETFKDIEIPDSVTYIGTRAFALTAFYDSVDLLKGGVIYVGNWAVDFRPALLEVESGTKLVSLKTGTKGISAYAFNKKNVLMFQLPDTVEYICEGAFNKCAGTYVINLPKGVKYIGDYAFYGCEKAIFGGTDTFDITIPEGTEYIGRSAFYGCTNNLSLTIPGTVKYIGPYAFYGCVNLGRTLELEVESGETDANGNPILKIEKIVGYINIGNGVEYIGDRAFQGCTSLVSVAIPDSVTYLGTRAFYKCAGIKELTLGSGITFIPDYTFYKCEALEKVVVSDKLEAIGNYAFRGCVALKDFDLKSIKSIGRYSFYGCAGFTSIVLPDSLESVGDYAFRGCNALTSVIISNSVTNIGKHVFYGLNNMTLWCESETVMPYWDSRFNSSNRPVFWGCTLSEDGKYVVSFTKTETSLSNWKATNGISNPVKDGYTFDGWATEQGSKTVAYTSETVSEAAGGTVLYAIWTQQ